MNFTKACDTRAMFTSAVKFTEGASCVYLASVCAWLANYSFVFPMGAINTASIIISVPLIIIVAVLARLVARIAIAIINDEMAQDTITDGGARPQFKLA